VSSRRPCRSRCPNCRQGRDRVTEMTEQHGLTPIRNTKRADSKRVFALMAAPTTLLPSTTTEAAMRKKRLSKDQANFWDGSEQSIAPFQPLRNAAANALTMPTADETWPEGRAAMRPLRHTHNEHRRTHLRADRRAPEAEHGQRTVPTKRRMRLHCSGAPPRVSSSDPKQTPARSALGATAVSTMPILEVTGTAVSFIDFFVDRQLQHRVAPRHSI
jgi:hypothetical protein